MSEVKQIQPNHADHISCYKDEYLSTMLSMEPCVAQLKYDGERMLIHFDHGNVYCTSRRFSKKTGRFMENQEKIPILTELAKKINLDYCVLDCEAYAKDWSTAVGILHSLPQRAIELQKENVLKFAIFDCLFYDGKDMRDERYIDRLDKAVSLIKLIDYENLHLVSFIDHNFQVSKSDAASITTKTDAMAAMNAAIANNFEGVVIKSLIRKYYDKAASLKCKKFETLDVVVCGYQNGRGKYENTVGALEIGYFDPTTNNVVRISRVNCGSDAEREMWNSHRTDMLYSVIEIKCQEVTEKSLRHPVYLRLRNDKDYRMCTRETIFKES